MLNIREIRVGRGVVRYFILFTQFIPVNLKLLTSIKSRRAENGFHLIEKMDTSWEGD